MTIVPENIRALSPIYSAAMLDELGAYAVADRLVELFTQGQLPVRRRDADAVRAASWTEARAKVSKAQRQSFYARVFGMAGGDPGVSPNREFNDLWMRFVSSVSALARQHSTDTLLNRRPPGAIDNARQAARDLAMNLSRYGLTSQSVVDLQQQIDAMKGLLGDDEIRRAYGVRDMWQLIERVSSLELGASRETAHRAAMAASAAVIVEWLARHAGDAASTPTETGLVDACERWLADSAAADSEIERRATPPSRRARDAASRLLTRSAAFAALSPAMQARVVRDTARIVDALVVLEAPDVFRRLVDEVDFPRFVADLITGVFNAIVDVSIRQMEAYADLVAAVAATIEQFRDSNLDDRRLRDRLCQLFPELCEPADRAPAPRSRLATMMALGINRIVVTNG